MKNIHIVPTDKPSRLSFDFDENQYYLQEEPSFFYHQGLIENRNICITSDEEKPKAGEWSLYQNKIHKCIEDIIGDEDCKKIILTTDQDLIKDGVQAIDDEFLEWFVKNPSCEEVEVIPLRKSSGYYDEKEVWHWDFLAYKIIIPKEEPKTNLERLPFPELVKEFAEYYKKVPLVEESKQETLEQAAKEFANNSAITNYEEGINVGKYQGFICGAKWQQETFKNYPVIIVRNDDKEEFIHLSNGMYRTKWGILHDSISSTPLESFDKSKFTFYYE